MKKSGIWLDKEKAHIVTIENGKESLLTVNSEVEVYQVSGGSSAKIKEGPQEVLQDSRFLEREKHQLKAYFKEIIQHIKQSDEIIIFGPAETLQKFKKELALKYAEINAKVIHVERKDSMTNNQIKALVRDHFQKL